MTCVECTDLPKAQLEEGTVRDMGEEKEREKEKERERELVSEVTRERGEKSIGEMGREVILCSSLPMAINNIKAYTTPVHLLLSQY